MNRKHIEAQYLTKGDKLAIGGTGLDKQERANIFWIELSEKYNFVWDSVRQIPGESNIKKFQAQEK